MKQLITTTSNTFISYCVMLELMFGEGHVQQSYCDVDIDDSLVPVIGAVGRLHSHVGDLNRARE